MLSDVDEGYANTAGVIRMKSDKLTKHEPIYSIHQLILVGSDGDEHSFREDKRLVFLSVDVPNRRMTSRERSSDQVDSWLVLVH